VTIARTLVRSSPILVLDEPTSGLDAETEHGILETLRTLMRQTTTLLVTHHMALVREADEIIVIEHGQIAARGTYDHLLGSSALFRRLAGARTAPPSTVPPPTVDRNDATDAPVHIIEHGLAGSAGAGARALFYSHNGVGVGHLQRQLDLASAFKAAHPDAAVLVVTGSQPPGYSRSPQGLTT
jgi:ABC-type sugar transport system ATPase subunit